MNPTVFSLAKGKQDRLGSLTLVWQPVYEKENSEWNPIKLFKKLSLLHPISVEVLGTYTYARTKI